MKLSIALVTVFATLAYTQIPQRCFMPREWTAYATQYDHQNGDVRKWIVHYDEGNQRKWIVEEEYVPALGQKIYEYLILNNVNMMYKWEIQSRVPTNCVKSTPRPWRSYGIPNNATFEREMTIGGPGEQITVQEWSDRIPYRQSETWIGTYTLQNCYPIREVIFNRTNNEESMTTNWYGFMIGIPDPSRFIPPPECNHAAWNKSPSRFHW